jgi:hypothetical protein
MTRASKISLSIATLMSELLIVGLCCAQQPLLQITSPARPGGQ